MKAFTFDLFTDEDIIVINAIIDGRYVFSYCRRQRDRHKENDTNGVDNNKKKMI